MSVLGALWSLTMLATPCGPGVPFTVQVESKFDGDELALTATLTNCGDAPLTHRGLLAGFEEPGPELREFGQALTMRDAQLVGPQARAQLRTTLQLQRYAYEGAPTFTVRWGIDGTEAHGALTVRLPKREKGATYYFIDHVPVSKAAFEARKQQLHGETHWTCAERSDGGETSYLAKDGAIDYRVTERSITVGITGGLNSITRASLDGP